MTQLNPKWIGHSFTWNDNPEEKYYTTADINKAFGGNISSNYTGKIKLFKDRQIPVSLLEDKKFFLEWIENNPAGKKHDYLKRFLYMLAKVAAKNPSVDYWNEYNLFIGRTPKDQQFKYISVEWLKKRKRELKKKYDGEKSISNLQNFILISLYTDVEALRADFNVRIDHEIESNLPHINFFDTERKLLILNKYKGSKRRKVPRVQYEIPDELNEHIKNLKMMKLERDYDEPSWLLHRPSSKKMTRQDYNYLLTKLTGNNKPIVKIRKGKVKSVFDKYNLNTREDNIMNMTRDKIPKQLVKDLRKLSHRMLHSMKTQQKHYTGGNQTIDDFREMFQFWNTKSLEERPFIKFDRNVEVEFIIEGDTEQRPSGKRPSGNSSQGKSEEKKPPPLPPLPSLPPPPLPPLLESVSVADLLDREIQNKIITKHDDGYNCSLCHKPSKRIKRKSCKHHLTSKKHLKLRK